LYRLGVEDGIEDSLQLEDGVKAAQLFEKYDVDILDISVGIPLSMAWFFGQTGTGIWVPQAKSVKEAVNLPVIGVGGIKNGIDAAKFISCGDVDLVAVGRAIRDDPDWATKALKELES
jgi:2,4-dienoyl-CoA reductase-like NADH-dependent reductase (Old Yellow Enzyme family)